MYHLKPIVPIYNIEFPNTMYSLKNINDVVLSADENLNAVASSAAAKEDDKDNATSACCTIINKNNHTIGAAAATITPTEIATTRTANAINTRKLDALDLDFLGAKIKTLLKSETHAIIMRQDHVLQQLKELQAQLAVIRAKYTDKTSNATNTASAATHNGGLKEEPLHDIVINGHPNFIPYALLALKNAWKDLFTIEVKTFTHSTMPDIGAEAREFEKNLAKVPVKPNLPKVNVTLIWKNCEHTEMISSPTMYVPIYGEVNIIRYLGRVGPEEYRYENSLLCNEIDAVLDICYQLLRCTTVKSKLAMIRELNNRLQKQKYFGGNKMSIADIGVYSSLKRMPTIETKHLTPTLIEWRKRAQMVTMI